MTVVVIALGSNLGDRVGNLRAAVREMDARGVACRRSSGIWETEPVPAGQPAYLNGAVVAETGLPPLELLSALQAIEHRMGRRPERRWGPRPIDLDILFYGDERIDLPGLQVPHERVLERAFVLSPLSDVWPGKLPVLGTRAVDALEATGLGDARRIGWL